MNLIAAYVSQLCLKNVFLACVRTQSVDLNQKKHLFLRIVMKKVVRFQDMR